MARKVACELGIAIGISSGANIFASILTREQEGSVVTVIPDDAKKYLSTDLLNDIADSDFLQIYLYGKSHELLYFLFDS